MIFRLSSLDIDIIEDLSLITPPSAEIYTLTNILALAADNIRIIGSNDIISYYAANLISVYANVPIEALSGVSKYLVSLNGSGWFANGTLSANTGAISVGGPGTNLLLVDYSGAQENVIRQVNSIVDGTSLTIRTPYPGGDLANGYFYYVASSSNTTPSA